jgi:hypothetical protein
LREVLLGEPFSVTASLELLDLEAHEEQGSLEFECFFFCRL